MRPAYVVRKEPYGWLIFNTQSRQIQRGSTEDVEEIKMLGAPVRVIVNPPVEGALSAPIKVFLDITNQCNLQCIHCLSASSPGGKDSLSFSLIQSIIEECYEAGVFMIKIGGGEPLLRADIWEIVHLIWSKGIAVSMSTNGTVITERILSNLKKYEVDISVSIDGDEVTHDLIRGKGIYRKAIRAIERMKSAGLNPSIRFTLMSINIRTVESVVELAQALGVKLKVRRVKPQKRSIENGLIIDRPSKEYFQALKILNSCSFCEIEDIMNFKGSIRAHLLLGPSDCGAATRSIHINSNGDVSPCVFLGDQFVDGNIQDTRLMEIWRSGKNTKAFRKLPLNEQCKLCDRRMICHAECPAIRLAVTGSLYGMDPGCIKSLEELP